MTITGRYVARCAVVIVVLASSACVDTGSEGPTGVSSADLTSSSDARSMTDLQQRLAALQARADRVSDADAIKRLQRAYGYYLDEALWDEIVELFDEEGTLEIGLDGVYVGKERIREYLYALGSGRQGLIDGQLNEHLQLMPVVTVSPDGLSARARWRAIILAGQLGGDAFWGEGPYENEYVKRDGVWKLKSVHWYQSVIAPYAQGWQHTADPTNGRWVSERLPPDRPPTVEYDTWPGTYLPPFHFPNPVLEPGNSDPDADAALAQIVFAAASRDALAASTSDLLERVQLIEDENSIERLQRVYGFYIDKGLWSEAADLFADNGTIEVGNAGVFVGKSRVLEYLRSRGPEFPQQGRLADRMQLQPIVHVAPNGLRARGRWHLFAQEAVHGDYARWATGIYENEYVKDNGVWKFQSLHLYNTMSTPYEDGWGKTALPGDGAVPGLAPDRPPTVPHRAYPSAFVAPFHYPNPVSGKPVYSGQNTRERSDTNASELESRLVELEERIQRLEDIEQLERLNAVYGYYLARNQWDDLTGIFSPDGSIEIAMRGVYVGRDSIRRNLDLYGEAGIHHGLLHNHMQYQPVISLADDGQSAKMRSRAFSIMGEFEAYAMWMGGVYENDFVKEDGIWKIDRDQVFNTYFVPYALGWKDVNPRPPPGITESNPPDLPPTHPFEMYPSAFLPPFHYPNPVTGKAVTWPSQSE